MKPVLRRKYRKPTARVCIVGPERGRISRADSCSCRGRESTRQIENPGKMEGGVPDEAKAPEDWRSPKAGARTRCAEGRGVECGRPLPLFVGDGWGGSALEEVAGSDNQITQEHVFASRRSDPVCAEPERCSWSRWNGQLGRSGRQPAAQPSARRLHTIGFALFVFGCQAGSPTERASGPFHPNSNRIVPAKKCLYFCVFCVLCG